MDLLQQLIKKKRGPQKAGAKRVTGPARDAGARFIPFFCGPRGLLSDGAGRYSATLA